MPIKTTLKKLPTDNPLAKVVKVQHLLPETTSEFADLEKIRTVLDKKSYGLDLVKSLLNKDVQDVRLMAALENQGLVDKYPTVAERKINNYNYRLYIPLDKSQSLVGTTVNYYVIDFAYGGDIFIFRFPIRLLNDRKTWKLDHYDATVEDGSFISGPNSLPKSLDIFSRTGSITDEGVLDIFKQYKIITNDDLTSLNFCITGHKISVIYSKEGKREVKEIAKVAAPVVVPAAPVVVPKATPVVTKKEPKPVSPEGSPIILLPPPPSVPPQLSLDTESDDDPIPAKPKNPTPLSPQNTNKIVPSDSSQNLGYRPDSLIDRIKHNSALKKAREIDYSDFTIPGVEYTIPSSALDFKGYEEEGQYSTNKTLPYIVYDPIQNKINLWFYYDYSDLYEKYTKDVPSGDERTKAVNNAVMFHNRDEYAKYVKANKK